MYIESIKLKKFRNYSNQVVNFKNGMNLILGENGIGKTNLLESIYLLSTTRSHRNDDEKDMIGFNEEFASVEGIVISKNGRDRLNVILHKKGKTLALNNTLVKRNSEFIGKLNAVIFSPSEMNLFDDSPRERRKLIDMEIGKLSSGYMYNLSNYLKSLKQRNAYLKQGNDKIMLDTYTEMIYEPQIKIIKERNSFINALNAYLSYFYNEISGSENELKMVYKSFIKEKNDEKVMLEEIKETYDRMLERDILLKQTNIGIHREDYEFYLNNINVSKYCSQGQKRMVILALKLSLVQIIYQIKREYPILLLDDVFSELDSNHRVCLLKLLPNTIQTIITTTDLREVSSVKKQNINIINITKGDISNGN
ncbi:MAG: DNA replication/repair protein RecF [Erysipelotrichia bacterium]|nr:DNA replication/repair protein RecF [Erysipelotrichia bacterium]